MSKSKKPVRRKEAEAVETDPGAWDRFEHAVDAAVKSGPKHRTTAGKSLPSKLRSSKTDNELKRPEK